MGGREGGRKVKGRVGSGRRSRQKADSLPLFGRGKGERIGRRKRGREEGGRKGRPPGPSRRRSDVAGRAPWRREGGWA
jgi:hypothetical protein